MAPEPARELCWNCQSSSNHSAAYCPALKITDEQWESLQQKLGRPAPGDPRYRRRGLTSPGPLPQYREPCCNCWTSRNHREVNCPFPKIPVPEREKTRIRLGVPLYAFWQDVLKANGVLREIHCARTDDQAVDEKCFNCWSSRAHGAEECPEPKLSTVEREKLRCRLRLPLLATWRTIMEEEGLCAVDTSSLPVVKEPEDKTTTTKTTKTRQRSKTVGSRIPMPKSRQANNPQKNTDKVPSKEPSRKVTSLPVTTNGGDDDVPNDVRELNVLITHMLSTLRRSHEITNPTTISTKTGLSRTISAP